MRRGIATRRRGLSWKYSPRVTNAASCATGRMVVVVRMQLARVGGRWAGLIRRWHDNAPRPSRSSLPTWKCRLLSSASSFFERQKKKKGVQAYKSRWRSRVNARRRCRRTCSNLSTEKSVVKVISIKSVSRGERACLLLSGARAQRSNQA